MAANHLVGQRHMSSTSRFRRNWRRVLALAVLATGGLLAWRLVRISPIVLGTSLAGMVLTLWWFRRRELQALGYLRGRFLWRDLLLAGMLVGGLWLGLYVVFSLGDIGFSAGAGTRIPIGRDSASLSVGDMLLTGLAATVSVMALAFPFRGTSKPRRDVRETALVGTAPERTGGPTPPKGSAAR